MRVRVITAADRGHKTQPTIREAAGLPVRVTSYAPASTTSSAEALVVITSGKIRSIICRPGDVAVYLSPRAKFELVAPPQPVSPEGGVA